MPHRLILAAGTILPFFGAVIYEARCRRHLTQNQLASRAHLNLNFVRDIEKGRRKPSLVTLFALADALEMTPSVLVQRTHQLWTTKKGRSNRAQNTGRSRDGTE